MRETVMDNAGKPARLTGRWPIKREIIGPPACPVMHRWTLAKVRGRKLMVHRFLPGSEDMSVHDHPAAFWTFVLRGGYDDIELCPLCRGRGRPYAALDYQPDCRRCNGRGEVDGDLMRSVAHWRWFSPVGVRTLQRRPAAHSHRTRALPRGAWTIVFMLPKSQAWGFWEDGRWWPWRDHERAFGFGMRCPGDRA
jgi:hypothetical protein